MAPPCSRVWIIEWLPEDTTLVSLIELKLLPRVTRMASETSPFQLLLSTFRGDCSQVLQSLFSKASSTSMEHLSTQLLSSSLDRFSSSRTESWTDEASMPIHVSVTTVAAEASPHSCVAASQDCTVASGRICPP